MEGPEPPADPPATLAPEADVTALSPTSQAPPSGRVSTLVSLARAGPTAWDSPPRTPLASGINAKQSQEREIFSAVRRQMESMEEKLSGQISRVQQQSERSREAAFSRVDSKLGTMELLQPRVDRRLAELHGNYKGISEEMQTQIRRIDQMDSRLWEWRHKLDEEIRGKLAEMEQAHQQVASSVRVTRATSEDVLKRYNQRLLRLEALVDERAAQHEDLSQGLMGLHQRLLESEGHDGREGRALARSQEPEPLYTAEALEGRVGDLQQRLSASEQELYDLRTGLEAQGEHLRSLRTQYEAKDEQCRGLIDRILGENWEARLKEVQGRVADIGQGHIDHSEQVQILQKKLDGHDEVQTELGHHVRRLQERLAAGLDSSARALDLGPGRAAAAEAQDCTGRLAEAEAQLGALGTKVESIQADLELAPRIAGLVDTLKDVSPRVIGQEQTMRQMQQKVTEFEEQVKTTTEGFAERIGRLEDDAGRLVYLVEGPQAARRASDDTQAPSSRTISVVNDAQDPPQTVQSQRRSSAKE